MNSQHFIYTISISIMIQSSTKNQPLSTQRLASSKASASRRNALREFYKLSAQTPAPIDHSSGSNSTVLEPVNEDSQVSNKSDEGIGAELDRLQQEYEKQKTLQSPDEIVTYNETPAIDMFIRKLVQENDLKRLLHFENELVSEIKTLDSEQKALVYNNYSKLTLASTTLASIKKLDDSDQLSPSEIFQKRSESNNSSSDNDKENNRLGVLPPSKQVINSSRKFDELLSEEKKQIIDKAIRGAISVSTAHSSFEGDGLFSTHIDEPQTPRSVRLDSASSLTSGKLSPAGSGDNTSLEFTKNLEKTLRWLVKVPEKLNKLLENGKPYRAKEIKDKALQVLQHFIDHNVGKDETKKPLSDTKSIIYHFDDTELKDLYEKIFNTQIIENEEKL